MYKKFVKKSPKEKVIKNIKDFSKNKILYTAVKARSPHTIVFLEDLEDSWFTHVTTYKTKAGTITNSSMIIADDIKTWLSHLLNLGYELKI